MMPWKKPVFTIRQRHIYFILKGRFEVTLQSFPGDIFRLDILWHFQLNIADIPAEELKACLKGTPALKLFLSLSIFLVHSLHSVSSSLTLRFPPLHAATRAYMHYLLSVVDLHLQVLEVFLIQRDYQKFYHPEYIRDRHKVCEWRKLMMLFWAKIQRLRCSKMPRGTCATGKNSLMSYILYV